jgi:hypothetical protein
VRLSYFQCREHLPPRTADNHIGHGTTPSWAGRGSHDLPRSGCDGIICCSETVPCCSSTRAQSASWPTRTQRTPLTTSSGRQLGSDQNGRHNHSRLRVVQCLLHHGNRNAPDGSPAHPRLSTTPPSSDHTLGVRWGGLRRTPQATPRLIYS